MLRIRGVSLRSRGVSDLVLKGSLALRARGEFRTIRNAPQYASSLMRRYCFHTEFHR